VCAACGLVLYDDHFMSFNEMSTWVQDICCGSLIVTERAEESSDAAFGISHTYLIGMVRPTIIWVLETFSQRNSKAYRCTPLYLMKLTTQI
jgi:hypothetical protein